MHSKLSHKFETSCIDILTLSKIEFQVTTDFISRKHWIVWFCELLNPTITLHIYTDTFSRSGTLHPTGCSHSTVLRLIQAVYIMEGVYQSLGKGCFMTLSFDSWGQWGGWIGMMARMMGNKNGSRLESYRQVIVHSLTNISQLPFTLGLGNM